MTAIGICIESRLSADTTSLTVTKRILGALHLKFSDVLTPEIEEDDAV